MNDHVTEPLIWDDTREYHRGKVLTQAQLDRIYAVATNGAGTRASLPAAADASSDASAGNGHLAGGTGDAGTDARVPTEDIDSQPDPEAEAAGSYLEQFKGKWGRYLDIDGDGIAYRTIPGTHPTKGAFVTRGSSRDEYAVYTEDADVYRRFVDRLARKWDTAKELVPSPVFYKGSPPYEGGVDAASPDGVVLSQRTYGVIFFGTSTDSALEALELLEADGIQLDAMRPRAFPFGKAFRDFVDAHERIFVIEQNRDAQFRSLMMIELGIEPAKLVSVLNYDGMPITADNIFRQIRRHSQP
jgi:hypothetical protein